MPDNEFLTTQFEAHREHLRGVAYRMLGSLPEADDAVQEAWIRLDRADTSDVENLGGWLTTVVSRVCLDMLRSRKSRRDDPVGAQLPDTMASDDRAIDPEHEAVLADSVGVALLVVLDTLEPAERLAFVLHDMFAVPFDEIAPIVGRTPTAARQLASRARRRVQGANASRYDVERQREVVEAFLAASRGGDFEALLALLDPNVVFRNDEVGVASGAPARLVGATAIAEQFFGRALGARAAVVDGGVGLVVGPSKNPKVAILVSVVDGKITDIEAILDPEVLAELQVESLAK